jgi:hypothetical protein
MVTLRVREIKEKRQNLRVPLTPWSTSLLHPYDTLVDTQHGPDGPSVINLFGHLFNPRWSKFQPLGTLLTPILFILLGQHHYYTQLEFLLTPLLSICTACWVSGMSQPFHRPPAYIYNHVTGVVNVALSNMTYSTATSFTTPVPP